MFSWFRFLNPQAKQVLLLLLPLTVFGSKILAANYPEPGNIGVTVDYLYLLPTSANGYFVIDAPTEVVSQGHPHPVGQLVNAEFDFTSAYRVGLMYAFSRFEGEARLVYTSVKSTCSKQVEGQYLWATAGTATTVLEFQNYAGTALKKSRIIYERLDPLYSQSVIKDDRKNLSLLAGVEYFLLHFHDFQEYETADLLSKGTNKARSNTWGIGPQVGLEFDYILCHLQNYLPGNISLTGTATGSLNTSQTFISERDQIAERVEADLTSAADWRMIPSLHMKMGVNYSFCMFDSTMLKQCLGSQEKIFSLEVGFESSTYFNAVQFMLFPDSTAGGLCKVANTNFSLRGFYASAFLSF